MRKGNVMIEKSDFDSILEFFQTHQRGFPGDIEYDSAFCKRLLKASFASEASIWRLDQEGSLRFSYGTHVAQDDIQDITLRNGEGIGGAVVLSRKAISVSNAWQEPRHDRRVDDRLKSRTHSMITAPILFGDIFYGTLNILNYKHGGAFPMQWKDLLSAAGTLYGSAMAAAGGLIRKKGLPSKQKMNHKPSIETVIVGVSHAIQEALSLCLKAAKSDVAVIVKGDTGTGKELAARRIHEAGTRPSGPFIGVNCAALTETLLESELFGHVKGAFSGADRDRDGKFLAASKGTLFLDEIGDMSQACQAKILRVLQEKKVTPVGSEKPKNCDPRIICATNHDLWKDIGQGRFREDLFYRLCGIEILMPPLHERPDDIPILANHFLRKLNINKQGETPSTAPTVISDQAMERLMSFKWPGNVRQLEQAIQAAYAICDGKEIMPRDFPDWFNASKDRDVVRPLDKRSNETGSKDDSEFAQERNRFMEALEATKYAGTGRWNLTAAAQKLSIPRKTFTYRLKRLQIKP
jgi:transcriptional regulator with GAF, ATPase, and Fis domain